MNLHLLKEIGTDAIVICAALYMFLPPVEKFNKYPRFQNGYQFCMIWFQWIGLSARGSVSAKIYGQQLTPDGLKNPTPDPPSQEIPDK